MTCFRECMWRVMVICFSTSEGQWPGCGHFGVGGVFFRRRCLACPQARAFHTFSRQDTAIACRSARRDVHWGSNYIISLRSTSYEVHFNPDSKKQLQTFAPDPMFAKFSQFFPRFPSVCQFLNYCSRFPNYRKIRVLHFFACSPMSSRKLVHMLIIYSSINTFIKLSKYNFNISVSTNI